MTRFAPIPDADQDADQRRMSERASHTGPYPAFLRAPVLWEALQHVRLHLAHGSVLDVRLRELAMLTTARHWRSTSAFASHRSLAAKAGLDEAIMDALAHGSEPASLDARERTAVNLVRHLLEQGGISDVLYAGGLEHLGERAMVELVGLVGFFTTICLTINIAGIGTDAGFAGAPGTYSPSGHNTHD